MKKFFKHQLAVCLVMLISNLIHAQSITVDSFMTGSGTWQVPVGVSSVTIELWGAGGGGGGSTINNNGGSGGGSGAYTKINVVVVSGYQYNYSVGVGGSAGAAAVGGVGGNGTSSTFVGLNLASSTNLTAGGGTGGAANAGAVGVGGATSGGDAGLSLAGTNGAVGGASGGRGGNAPSGGTGGAAISNSPGNAGNAPGGGGGGGELIGSARAGGAGGNGKIKISYTVTMDVELTKFEGKNLKEKNQLNWATASETNNNFFMLQKSVSGENWEDVEKIYGAGTSLMTNNYETIDYKPYFPITYYRLKQVDFDGSLTYSDVISLSGEEVNNNFVSDVYPNPTSDLVNFSFQGEEDKQVVISILNEMGQIVSNSVLENPGIGHTYSINTGELSTGNYFVSISQGAKIKNQRIQIQH